ncbi:MAG: hypothetical protein OEZ01_14255, partial [Candidatus Heimdallarchaeota archaeon]|nr:hypothetical protein [Candidatus Heimdallarchaeota archaeon]
MSPSKPMSKVELKITLQSGEDIFILKNSITDKFGVFSGSMETDRFMNPQKYQLVFSSKHLKISESKEIEISDYQKPSMKLDIDPIDSIMQGEPINVSATAMYFYGDPISNEVCELRVIDSDRDIAGTLELQTADDGTINQSISTEAISPGLCHVKVTVINSVGQVVEGTRSFRVFESKKNTQVSEEYQKFNTLSWSVSPTMEIITSQQSESTTPNQDNFLIKLKFDFESSLMVWTSRPIYYIWRDNDGCVIDYGYFYPKGIEDEELLLPIIAEKTYFLLDLIRIEYSGMYKLKTLKFLNDPSNIQIKLDGPDVLNPGESFDLQITTPNNSKSKSMLLAMLDSSSKEIAGSNIGDNFNTLFNEFHNNMEISNTFSEDIFELSRSLDEFFSYALEEWEEDTSLFPLSYLYALIISLYKSPIVDKKMFEYHQSNVLTLLSNNPESIIPFLYDLINLNLIDLIDFDEFDEELFKGNLLKLLQNIHSGLNNQENLQLLHLVRILLDKIHVEILSILKSIASIYPQFLSVIDVEKYTELNNLMKGKLLLNEKNFSDYLKVSKLISEQLSDLNLTKIMVKNIHLLWMDGEKLLFGNFFAADPYFSIPSFYGLPKYQSIMSDVDHYVGGGTLIPHALNLIPTVGKKTVRSYFPDVAYWIPDHIMEGNKETFQLKVPDSITEQEIIVLASTLSNDFGIARKKIHVQQEFFVQPQIPATIHYRDIFEIRAVVTNRTSQEQMVSVQLLLVNGGFQMYSKSEQKIKVAANSRKEVTWDVEAISVGTFPIEFTATTKDFQDIVKKSIRVDPKGLPEVRLFEGRLEKDEFDIVYSSEEVAHYLNVAFFPNKYSIALDGLE